MLVIDCGIEGFLAAEKLSQSTGDLQSRHRFLNIRTGATDQRREFIDRIPLLRRPASRRVLCFTRGIVAIGRDKPPC
jgi:hypothetical protein